MIKNVLFTAFAVLALAACSDPAERAEAAAGRCTRTWEGVSRMWGNMFASMAEMSSFANVVNLGGKKSS